MPNMFVYGSLMFEPVWRSLLPGRYEKLPAILMDYRRLKIKGADYPGLRHCTGDHVDGVLVLELCSGDISILDRFEGHAYQRRQVMVTTQHGQPYRCEVYVTRSGQQHRLSESSWDADEFQAHHLQRFLGS